jgi:nucleolar protein 12
MEGGDFCNFYVLFEDAQPAEQAISLNGTQFKGSNLRVDWACGNTARDYKRCIFVGNLTYYVKDDELRAEFSEIGEVDYVRVIRDPETHQSKGIAYVCFVSRDSASRALCKHGAWFNVRPK